MVIIKRPNIVTIGHFIDSALVVPPSPGPGHHLCRDHLQPQQTNTHQMTSSGYEQYEHHLKVITIIMKMNEFVWYMQAKPDK